MRRLAPLAAALAVSVLAGCGGDEGAPAVERTELPDVVLQPADLTGYRRSDQGPPRVSGEESGLNHRAWHASYRLVKETVTSEVILVEAEAEAFAGDAEAATGFRKLVSRVSAQGDLTTGLPAVPLDAPRVGDEARAWSADLGGVEVVTVAWRSANVAAWISVQSFDAESAERGAFAAVRKQQRRIEVALN